VLLGASSVRQMYENIRSSEITLTEEHVRNLDALVAPPALETNAWRAAFFEEDAPLDEVRLP
jgi:hypothetical protein